VNHRELALDSLVHGKQPGIVNGKYLGVRVHLDALKTQIDNPLGLIHNTVHRGVQRAKSGEFRVLCHLADDKIVDMLGALRLQGNGQHHIAADTGGLAVGQQVIHSAGQVAATDLIEIPDALGSFVSNRIGIDVAVKIDQLQVYRLDVQNFCYYSTFGRKCKGSLRKSLPCVRGGGPSYGCSEGL